VLLYEVLVADLANSIVLFNEFRNKSMGVLGLVNVVDVQLEERNDSLDNVSISRVLLVSCVPFKQYLV
jgi:hypothetical protein